jgi:hypothetical protein
MARRVITSDDPQAGRANRYQRHLTWSKLTKAVMLPSG